MPDYCPHFDGRIEYPRGSGIHISKRRNRCLENAYGLSYLVEIPGRLTGCGRRRRQFKSHSKAVGFAQLCAEGQKKMGQMFHQLPHRKLLEITLGAFVEPVDSKKQTSLLAEVIDELVAIKLDLYENGIIRQRTYESFALQLQSIKRHFGRRGTDLITKNSIVRWLRSMPHSQRTKQNYLNALKELLKFAVARGYAKHRGMRYIHLSLHLDQTSNWHPRDHRQPQYRSRQVKLRQSLGQKPHQQ